MAISAAPANVATTAMQAIPFNSMIGGPLKACIEAQAMAAQTSWEFIQNVGLNTDPKTGEKKAVNVSFTFNQGGRMVQLNVPLLTIVPIPYIAIHTIDINFKANINASSSSVKEDTSSKSTTVDGKAKGTLNLGIFKLSAELKANYSSKKDSKATEESKYSVESTIDVNVKAGQESMPAGLAKVLELLGNSLDVTDAKGELTASATELEGGDRLVITYKNPSGLYEPKVLSEQSSLGKIVGDSYVIESLPDKDDTLTFNAGKSSITVTVKAKPKPTNESDKTAGDKTADGAAAPDAGK